MSAEVEKNIQVMRCWFEAINSGDTTRVMQALDEYYTDDYQIHDPSDPNPLQGLQALKAGIDEWLKTRTEIHANLEDIIGMGDKTATRLAFDYVENETHEKKDRIAIFFSRFVEGKIAEEWQVVWRG